jgi:hypothetical protein
MAGISGQSISLTRPSDSAVQVYVIVGPRNGNQSTRLDTDTDNSAPSLLGISHNTTVDKSRFVTDNHLLQLARTKIDADGIPRTHIVNVTSKEPRSPIFTSVDFGDLINMAGQFLYVDDNRAAWRRGEI